jgi:hypothetical protein
LQQAIARTSGDETSAPADDGLFADPATDPFRELTPT